MSTPDLPIPGPPKSVDADVDVTSTPAQFMPTFVAPPGTASFSAPPGFTEVAPPVPLAVPFPTPEFPITPAEPDSPPTPPDVTPPDADIPPVDVVPPAVTAPTDAHFRHDPATIFSPPIPGIEAQHLFRAFGPVKAVDGITFTAEQGKVTALIGPNGSGKTTLLLILAGLLSPDSGQAFILGHDVAKENLQARCLIGWMPDIFGTWDTLTPLEILTTFGRAYGLTKTKADARAWELLRQLWLVEFAKQPARVLSRGQKQRLGLARALVHDPQVLLLDEPASGLDPRSRIELRDIVRGLAEQGKTVLISSHVLSELEEFTDKAVFLSRGRTVDADAGSEITTRGWRLAAADPISLRSFLTSVDIPWKDAPGSSGEVIITLAGFDSATQLLRTAVGAGIPLHTIAPLTGRLEEAYLTLNEDRR